MSRIRQLPLTLATTLLITPAVYGQVDINSRPADVRVGDQQGVEVETPRTNVQVDPNRASNAADRLRNNPRRGEMSLNREIAEWLIIDQTRMTKLAEFGLDRIKNERIRQLAETIRNDHQQAEQRLSSFVQDQPRRETSATDPNADNRRRAGAAREAAAEAREGVRESAEARRDARNDRRGTADDRRGPLDRLADRTEAAAERIGDRIREGAEDARDAIDGAVGPGVVDPDGEERPIRDGRIAARLNDGLRGANASSVWVDIHRDMSQQLSKVAVDELERYQGNEFDQAYLGMVSAAHLHQLATLRAMEGRATGELQNVIRQAAETTQQHLRSADDVMRQLN